MNTSERYLYEKRQMNFIDEYFKNWSEKDHIVRTGLTSFNMNGVIKTPVFDHKDNVHWKILGIDADSNIDSHKRTIEESMYISKLFELAGKPILIDMASIDLDGNDRKITVSRDGKTTTFMVLKEDLDEISFKEIIEA